MSTGNPELGRAVLELSTDSTTFFADLAASEKATTALKGVFASLGKDLKSLGTNVDAVGQQLRKHADDTDKAKDAHDGLGASILKTAAGFLSAQAIWTAGTRIFGGIVELAKDTVKAAADEEVASAKLRAALIQQGTATPSVIAAYQQLADQYQRTTVFSDHLLQSTMGTLAVVGNVMPRDMGNAVKAVTNLASAFGGGEQGLEKATLAVSKAAEGNLTTLSRMGVVVDTTVLKSQGFSAVLEAINQKFGGQAAALAETYTGRVAQLGNAWERTEESVGRIITQNVTVLTAFGDLSRTLQDASHDFTQEGAAANWVSTAVIGLIRVSAGLVSAFGSVMSVGDSVVLIFKALEQTALGVAWAYEQVALGLGKVLKFSSMGFPGLANFWQGQINEVNGYLDTISVRMLKNDQAMDRLGTARDQWKAGAEGVASALNAEADKLEKTRGQVKPLTDALGENADAWNRQTKAVNQDAAEKKKAEALKELTASADDLTASQKALVLSYLELGETPDLIATAKGWNRGAVEDYARAVGDVVKTFRDMKDLEGTLQAAPVGLGNVLAQFGEQAFKLQQKAFELNVAVTPAVNEVAFQDAAAWVQQWAEKVHLEGQKETDAAFAETMKSATANIAADRAMGESVLAEQRTLNQIGLTDEQKHVADLEERHQQELRDLDALLAKGGVKIQTEYASRKKTIDDYYAHEEEVAKHALLVEGEALQSFGATLQNLGGTAGEVGSAVSTIGGLFKAIDALNTKGASSTEKWAAGLQAASAIIGQFAQQSKVASVISGALSGGASGALIGAKIGAAGGPIGVGIGAAIGAIAGGIAGLFGGGPNAEEQANAQATQNIRQFEQQLLDVSGSLQDIDRIGRAIGVDLESVWGATGTAGLAQFTAATKAFKEAEADLVDSIHHGSGVATQALLALMTAYEQSTTDLRKTADQFYADQLTQAETGLGAALQGMQAAADAEAKAVALASNLAAGMTQDAAQKAADAVTGTVQLAEDQASGLGASVAGAFAESISRGTSLGDTVKALAPTIATLEGELAASGVSGGAAFALIEKMANAATGTLTGPLVTAIEGAGQAIGGFYNDGLMTQDVYTGLTKTVGQAMTELEAQGVDRQTVLLDSEKTLQAIYDLQQAGKFTVDAVTQSWLDQAEAQGMVGDKAKSDSQKTVDALQSVADKLGVIADFFTKLLPAAVTQGFETIEAAATHTGGVFDDTFGAQNWWANFAGLFGAPTTTPPPKMHGGGIVPSLASGAGYWPLGATIARAHTGMLVGQRALAAGETPIIAQAGEGILSRGAGMPALAASALSSLNAGHSIGGGGVSPQELAQAIVTGLRTGGLGGDRTFTASFQNVARDERDVRDRLIPQLIDILNQGGDRQTKFRAALRIK